LPRGQSRPVGARNLAALYRFLPEGAHFTSTFGPSELIDRDAMTPVERLVQQLGALMMLAGEQHPAHVQIVLVGGCRFLEAEFYENLTQFGGRQARADDRAMQVGIELPYLSTAP
jgi:hypothetical protein